jgi:hypothetical protein
VAFPFSSDCWPPLSATHPLISIRALELGLDILTISPHITSPVSCLQQLPRIPNSPHRLSACSSADFTLAIRAISSFASKAAFVLNLVCLATRLWFTSSSCFRVSAKRRVFLFLLLLLAWPSRRKRFCRVRLRVRVFQRVILSRMPQREIPTSSHTSMRFEEYNCRRSVMRCRIRPESDVVLVALVGSWSLLANIERCEDILQRSLVASIVTLWCVMCICCLYLPCVACGFDESEIGPLGIDD